MVVTMEGKKCIELKVVEKFSGFSEHPGMITSKFLMVTKVVQLKIVNPSAKLSFLMSLVTVKHWQLSKIFMKT